VPGACVSPLPTAVVVVVLAILFVEIEVTYLKAVGDVVN